ncbi:MAG: metal-dependent hydrolase [Desulfopila sp.]|jgi:inner membrane protein|nr:metal-dependent hydrolase [Desulfopila sp.]
MDSITQATLGAVVGHLSWHKQLGPKALLAGAVIGTVPDLDIILYPLLDGVQRLYWHRGESHSVFFLVFGVVATTWLLQRYFFKGKITFATTCWGVFLIYSTHILIDTFTIYGTQLLAPLSRKGYGIGNFFIIDPLFTLLLLAGVAYICLGKPSRHTRVNSIMLILAACYTAWSLAIQSTADAKFRNATDKAGYEVTRHITTAGPFTTFLWRHLAEIPDGYILGYWSIFDGSDKNIVFHFIPKSAEKTKTLNGGRSFAVIEWFSQGWWCAIPSSEETVRIIDLRFTEIPSSHHQGHQYWNWPFSWNFTLALGKDQPLQPLAPELHGLLPTLKLLAHRIAGGYGWLSDNVKMEAPVLGGPIEMHLPSAGKRGNEERGR